jgi:hypothetical protein
MLTWDGSKMDKDVTRERVVTEALIMYTMVIGMGVITDHTSEEFFARIHFFEKLNGTNLKNVREDADGSQHLDDIEITLDDVRAHIGLRTNVSLEPWNKFAKRTVDNWASRYMKVVNGKVVVR